MGYTQLENLLLEKACLLDLSGAQFRVLLMIIRYTIGFHVDDREFSYTYLQKGTGLARATIRSAVIKLLEIGVIYQAAGPTLSEARRLGVSREFILSRGLEETDGMTKESRGKVKNGGKTKKSGAITNENCDKTLSGGGERCDKVTSQIANAAVKSDEEQAVSMEKPRGYFEQFYGVWRENQCPTDEFTGDADKFTDSAEQIAGTSVNSPCVGGSVNGGTSVDSPCVGGSGERSDEKQKKESNGKQEMQKDGNQGEQAMGNQGEQSVGKQGEQSAGKQGEQAMGNQGEQSVGKQGEQDCKSVGFSGERSGAEIIANKKPSPRSADYADGIISMLSKKEGTNSYGNQGKTAKNTGDFIPFEAEKKPFGIFKNVMLTDGELRLLEEKYGSGVGSIIDNFSAKLKSKGYSYSDHYAAIILWGLQDEQKEKKRLEEEKQNGFDTEEFFKVALRSSYRGMENFEYQP